MIESFVAIVILVVAVGLYLGFRQRLERFPGVVFIMRLAAISVAAIMVWSSPGGIYSVLISLFFCFGAFNEWRRWRDRRDRLQPI